jgi:hypothetical protein
MDDTFLGIERRRQADFKAASSYFSDAARADGIYRGRARPFCLPRDCAEENLFAGIRQPITTYFAAEEIKWHNGEDRRPSNHMCSSQVCCANFLFPFANNPRALTELVRPVFPTVHRMLPMENEGQFVSFEWIGQKNYLGERISRNGKRTRGANFTSADAAIMFEHTDGRRQIVLIEWKYTESYGRSSLKIAKSGTDRTAIYAHLYDAADCPLNRELLPSFESLFYEPFYQLMRQQFLAHEMEKAHELGADVVSVMHIAPAHNHNFCKVTSPALGSLGDTAMGIWKRLVRIPNRFTSICTEQLFNCLPIELLPEMAPWWEYVGARYDWLTE